MKIKTEYLNLFLMCIIGSWLKEGIQEKTDPGSIPESGRSPGEGNGNPLQYSCLENPMDREEPGRLQSMGLQSHTRLSD